MKKLSWVGVLILFFQSAVATPSIKYTLSFPEPQTHYVNVKMEVTGWDQDSLMLKLPVWTPGSYMVREYSRFVESFTASSGGKKLAVAKFRKNGWIVDSKGMNSLTVEYKVYAFELTVRTAFIDAEHAYLNGAAIFLYIDRYLSLPSTIEVVPHSAWKKISVALERVNPSNPWIVKALNYDELADSPFEIGNHKSIYFHSAGVDHEVALFGEANYDTVALKKDLSKIAEQCFLIFGEHPCKRYLYIVHHLHSGGGGLEHSNSTTIQVSRTAYSGASYHGFLSLAAHEYFHLWNVKRLRPAPLGPFDYDNENYSTLLYMAEGFTSYYDELLLMRCGFVTIDSYLSTLAGTISNIENTPGNDIQPVSDAGFDAWIKYYRPTENSANSTISYYTKGSVLAAIIDLTIISLTNAEKNLDDVLNLMYQEYYKKLNRGFTEAELIASIEKVCDCEMRPFFEKYVYSIDTIPYGDFFSNAGLKLIDRNAGSETPYLGVIVSAANNKMVITNVERNSPAWFSGLNVNDEILSVNGKRASDDFVKQVGGYKPGDLLKLMVSRSGVIKELEVKLIRSPKVAFAFEKMGDSNDLQKRIFEKWQKR